MTTRLEKTLKRELAIDGRLFMVVISPQGLKLTLKGRRQGQELRWRDLVSGEAALAVALNASVGRFERAPRSKAPANLAPPAAAPGATAAAVAKKPGRSRAPSTRPRGTRVRKAR